LRGGVAAEQPGASAAAAGAGAAAAVKAPVAVQLLAELSWSVPEPQLDWLVARARQAAQSLERKPGARRARQASRDGPQMAEPSRDAAAPLGASAAAARAAPGEPAARRPPVPDGMPRRPVRRHHPG